MLASMRLDDLLLEASQIGAQTQHIGYYNLHFLSQPDCLRLAEAAKDLHLLWFHQQLFNCTGSDVRLKERMDKDVAVLEQVAAQISQ
jgi:hypothetical protein